MSKDKPRNPIVFESEYVQGIKYEGVVTLRDLFAAFAMAGKLARADAESHADFAADAYEHADAMLAERGKLGGAA